MTRYCIVGAHIIVCKLKPATLLWFGYNKDVQWDKLTHSLHCPRNSHVKVWLLFCLSYVQFVEHFARFITNLPFSALHGMPAQTNDEKGVRPSVYRFVHHSEMRGL